MRDNNNNRLLYVILGIITTIFTGVTVAMWFQINSAIADVKEDVRAVCIMQDNQEKIMDGQKQLLTNHVQHIREMIDYMREDMVEIREELSDVKSKKK